MNIPEGEQKYSSTLSLTSALDGGGWLTPLPARFTPGKETRDTLYGRLGGPQGRSERGRKISPPPVFDVQTAQPIASRCIEYVQHKRTGQENKQGNEKEAERNV